MHKEILESARYSEVTFRPDRVDGKVLAPGTSQVQVDGMFGIHGAEHEITVPAQVELASDHWSLRVHFAVPYVKWGMKDPSTFILRVGKTVDIDLHAQGPSPWVAQRQLSLRRNPKEGLKERRSLGIVVSFFLAHGFDLFN
jgi:hypothetical protein